MNIFGRSNTNTYKRIRYVRHVACKVDRRGPNRILVGRPNVKRPFRRYGCRWEDNNKIDFQ